MLTGDTTVDLAYLNAEYIINGVNVKIGQNMAGLAAAAIAADLVSLALIRRECGCLVD